MYPLLSLGILHLPEGVVETTSTTTEGWLDDLDDVHGSSRSSNGDTKAEEESASAKYVGSGEVIIDPDCAALDDGSNDDDSSAGEHATLAAKVVDDGSDSGKGTHGSDLIKGCNDTSPDTGVGTVEEVLPYGVDEQVVEQGAIVSVGGRAAECHEAAVVEVDGCSVEVVRRFLLVRFGKGFGTGNGLDGLALLLVHLYTWSVLLWAFWVIRRKAWYDASALERMPETRSAIPVEGRYLLRSPPE